MRSLARPVLFILAVADDEEEEDKGVDDDEEAEVPGVAVDG